MADSREENQNKNEEFVQGLEKLVLSMKGQKYTGIIIAETTGQQQLKALRKSYEQVYTQLSPLASTQINYGQNLSSGTTRSEAEVISASTTKSVSRPDTDSTANTTGTTLPNGTTKKRYGLQAAEGSIGGCFPGGAALAPVTGGVSLAVGGVISGGLVMAGSAVSKSVSDSTSHSSSKSVTSSHTLGTSSSATVGSSHTSTYGTSLTEGTSHALTLTAHDKTVENMLARIDRQLKRMDEFESLGMYECAAYFLSEDQAAAEMAASAYKALMGGENTGGVEIAVVNSWSAFEPRKTALVGSTSNT